MGVECSSLRQRSLPASSPSPSLLLLHHLDPTSLINPLCTSQPQHPQFLTASTSLCGRRRSDRVSPVVAGAEGGGAPSFGKLRISVYEGFSVYVSTNSWGFGWWSGRKLEYIERPGADDPRTPGPGRAFLEEGGRLRSDLIMFYAVLPPT